MAISEAGNDDLLQGVKKENFMKCEMGRLNDKSTIESKLKSIKRRLQNAHVWRRCQLPCFVFLCEKGRMGDTFPASLQVVDLRLRSGGTYSCFMQEFGRVCRYVKRDEDKFRFHNNEWVWENHFKEGRLSKRRCP
ncbi:hypothetical protein BASA82_000287 [Batrachochytrium salamandrivorans]|nr:hypothetical protein BASA82_000287 [Batrachochytrium salamandrivorans]